jgi:hypothetical protein
MTSQAVVENYFNYFTEIEERFQQRRGGALLLSTLDWALIETWKDAGIPLEAALRGIDNAFDSYDRKPARARVRKINSLAYCSQEVLAAADEMKEASVGKARAGSENSEAPAGMGTADVSAYLRRNSEILRAAAVPATAQAVVAETAKSLQQLADESSNRLEYIERQLTVLESRMLAALLAATSDTELLAIRNEAERDIAPYRSKMQSAQIEQLHRQYVNKRLLERSGLPRLSLFYM